MASRLKLQALLEETLGSRNVYFQPPESIKMNYPAIVYSLDNIENVYADDGVYLSPRVYQITLIDRNPDSDSIGKLASLKSCRFVRHYKSDNLNHYVYRIYF